MKAKMLVGFLISLTAVNANAGCWATRLDPICPKPHTVICKAKSASGGQFAVNYDEQTQSVNYAFQPTKPCNERTHRICPDMIAYNLNSANQTGFEGKVDVQPEQLHLKIGNQLDLQMQGHNGAIAISNFNLQGENVPTENWECITQ
ncbi:MAG TPA: hypothetical protein VF412_10855 [Bdellovibrio sp.]|uniref:hypothetical protein n=1 Tax=Bdellovibrio sp. TaxID=28201 RepID=UPI002F23FEB4